MAFQQQLLLWNHNEYVGFEVKDFGLEVVHLSKDSQITHDLT